ncbi:LysR family transcriptional regulator [Phreatobacter stygius]|nr:LysR family transcriptional regulator [Phreatobacter stygius]
MPLSYDDVAVFVGVAREGSFVGAARVLGMPVSTVSRRVAALEARLKVQLLRRTTRAVNLTEDGRAFASRCGTAFDEIASAAEALAATAESLRGTLRVTAPFFVCPDTFGPSLLEFAAGHPDLVMDLRFTNAEPDLVEEGIDLAFQLGPLRDGRHVARKLWPVPYRLCASHDFIAGRPDLAGLKHPRELAGHPAVLTPPMLAWSFDHGDGREFALTPKISGATVDDLVIATAAVRRGLGLGFLPEALVAGDLGHALVEIEIGDWRPTTREFFAVYPASRQLSPKVRAAIDHALTGRGIHG